MRSRFGCSELQGQFAGARRNAFRFDPSIRWFAADASDNGTRKQQNDSDSDEEEGSQLRRQDRPAFLAV